MNPSPLKILEFDITSFNYKVNRKTTKEYYIVEPKNTTFKITTYENEKQKNKFRIDFLIMVGNKNSPASIELRGYAVLVLPKDLKTEKNDQWLINAVFPMLFSTLRGYIFAATLNSPVQILLPLVNIVKSLDDILSLKKSSPKKKSKKNSK